MLTGTQIKRKVRSGSIHIDPFHVDQVGPNSYDVRLHHRIFRVRDRYLDLKKPYSYDEFVIGESGLDLHPDNLYLGVTREWTYTPHHIPAYEGRSTLARYFVYSHATAGFGDVGFCGHWTLEIVVQRPTRIYAGIRVGQLSFVEPMGPVTGSEYKGSYGDDDGADAQQRDPRPQPAKPGNL